MTTTNEKQSVFTATLTEVLMPMLMFAPIISAGFYAWFPGAPPESVAAQWMIENRLFMGFCGLCGVGGVIFTLVRHHRSELLLAESSSKASGPE